MIFIKSFLFLDDEFEGNETATDKLRLAIGQALGMNGNVSDQESVDLDDMSDSEADRLDEVLGKVFKEYKPNLGRKKKQSKEEEALTHFRVRVLDLIEIFLESEPSMYLTLVVMLPLLQILEFSIREKHQKPLHDRVSNLLKKLSNLKKFSSVDEVDEVVLKELLSSILEKGTRTQNIIQEMDGAISECCLFCLKCSQILVSGDLPKKAKKSLRKSVIEIFQEAFRMFFSKRESSVPYALLKGVLQNNWTGNIELSDSLCEVAFDSDVRIFKRCQALVLLKLFLSNNRLLVSLKDDDKSMSKLTATLKQFVVKSVEVLGEEVNEKYVANLFSCLTTLRKSPLSSDEYDWVNVGNVAREFRAKNKLSNDALGAFKGFCKAIGVSYVVEMKRETVEGGLNKGKLNKAEGKLNKGEGKKLKKRKNESTKQSESKENHDQAEDDLNEGNQSVEDDEQSIEGDKQSIEADEQTTDGDKQSKKGKKDSKKLKKQSTDNQSIKVDKHSNKILNKLSKQNIEDQADSIDSGNVSDEETQPAKKSKIDESEPKKKRKMSKESLKAKKEARLARLQINSEGFGSFNFAGANLEDNEDNSNNDDNAKSDEDDASNEVNSKKDKVIKKKRKNKLNDGAPIKKVKKVKG